MKAAIDYDVLNRRYQLFVWSDERDSGDSVCMVFEPRLERVPEGAALVRTMDLRKTEGELFFKALAEALEQAGYVKPVRQATEAELAATKFHLEDMRKLAGVKNGSS